MAVGRALEGLLSVPVHSLRVTAHHPEHFLVLFTQSAHQVNALRRGSIRVEGASFNIASWHEHDHAIFDSLHRHVRVVIEMVPMQFWSVEGAEEILGKRVRVDWLDNRTLERGHTKTFACWIWTSDIANIPTSHTMAVLPRGAGRVEEMEGFSPPDRRVAPPPATADYTMLIHVDRIEDWMPPPLAPLTPAKAASLRQAPTTTPPLSRWWLPPPGRWGSRTGGGRGAISARLARRLLTSAAVAGRWVAACGNKMATEARGGGGQPELLERCPPSPWTLSGSSPGCPGSSPLKPLPADLAQVWGLFWASSGSRGSLFKGAATAPSAAGATSPSASLCREGCLRGPR
ncbi:D-3-phosphoglycerate dehydrogenase, chloroplastic [Hordeum vulgare]|nr:D-3-phosphoglycerate dehydrogenase, chloroplastic [Hordeum vulgare]